MEEQAMGEVMVQLAMEEAAAPQRAVIIEVLEAVKVEVVVEAASMDQLDPLDMVTERRLITHFAKH